MKRPLQAVPWAVAAVTVGSFALALWVHDPHVFQRGGAVLLAAGAGLIFWQLRIEATLEQSVERAKESDAQGQRLPNEKLAAEIARLRSGRLVDEASGERLHLISYLAAITALGEGIHGFGDLAVEAVLCLGL